MASVKSFQNRIHGNLRNMSSRQYIKTVAGFFVQLLQLYYIKLQHFTWRLGLFVADWHRFS